GGTQWCEPRADRTWLSLARNREHRAVVLETTWRHRPVRDFLERSPIGLGAHTSCGVDEQCAAIIGDAEQPGLRGPIPAPAPQRNLDADESSLQGSESGERDAG